MSGNGNILLAFRNHALPTAGATAKSSSEAGALTAAAAQSPKFEDAWRALAFQEAAWYRLAFPRPRMVDLVALHNLRWRDLDIDRVEWRVQGGPAFGIRPEDIQSFDTGWGPIVERGRREDFGWRELEWSLGPSLEQLERGPVHAYRHFPGEGRPVRELLLSFRVPKGAAEPTAYLGFAHLTAGPAFQPPENFSWGWTLGVKDTSTVKRSEGGSLDGNERPKLMRITFDLAELSAGDAFRRLLGQWFKTGGALRRVWVVPNPARADLFWEQAFLGAAEPGTVSNPHWEAYTASRLTIEETR